MPKIKKDYLSQYRHQQEMHYRKVINRMHLELYTDPTFDFCGAITQLKSDHIENVDIITKIEKELAPV